MVTKPDETDVRPMLPLPEWMTRSDLIILNFLDGHEVEDLAVPPLVLSRNTSIAKSTARARLRALTDGELVEKMDDTGGYYRLTDLGRRFVHEELTDEEQERIYDQDKNR